jgi:SPP1 family predicted phage head-tail adaptor
MTIQKNAIIRDELGSEFYQQIDVATVWAEVKAISGRERVASGAVFSEATVRIWLRYRADVTTDNSITYHGAHTQGTAFSIMAVIPDAKHTRLELLCKGGIFR